MQGQKEQRSEERTKRLAVALTVAGTLLVLFLIIILIVQFVQMGVTSSRKRALDKQIEEYERVIADDKKDLEYYQTFDGMYFEAIKNGWKNNGGK